MNLVRRWIAAAVCGVLGAGALASGALAATAAGGVLRPAEKRSIERLLDRFVPAAVERQHPLRAYELATPGFRAGTSRAQWALGELPVQPYLARGRQFHGITFVHRIGRRIVFELMLQPRPDSKLGAISFSVERVRGRWLVDAFAPSATFAPPGSTSRILAAPDYGPHAGPDDAKGRLGAAWLAVPAAVVLLVLLVPLGFLGRHWLRERRAMRAAGGPGPIPPGPRRDGGHASHST